MVFFIGIFRFFYCEGLFQGLFHRRKRWTCKIMLTLIWVGMLGVRFEVKLPPPIQIGVKSAKRHFDPSLYILHVATNDLSLEDIMEVISERIIATVGSLKKEHNEVAI